ncbi:carbohydrate porin [Caulobacter sp. KR2-114]|uniref:carbohydrate porin n=1 Tax=Caulobacter sp. KR2-114 TaxID=3400912 RepID=UPI003C011547
MAFHERIPAACLAASLAALAAATVTPARAADDGDAFALHAQTTVVGQAHPAFDAAYSGANSLQPGADARETWDVTLYAGAHPWKGGEIWINPEIDQGFGLSDTLGVAGFPSGEAYKVGKSHPYVRLQRLFLRQTFDLGGDAQPVDADLNQFAARPTANRLVVTLGKFGVTDVFDTNPYAHDPRRDFLNWSLIDTGTFDYAADAWGYSAGAAVELYEGDWTVRAGAFDLSDVPNSARLDPHFDQYQVDGEIERRFRLHGQDGAVAITGFVSHGRMGSFNDAVALGQATGQPADLALVRRMRNRAGVSANLSLGLSKDIGVFVRAGTADGDVEPYEFADIDRTFAAGVSVKGGRWGRADDTVGLAGVVNGISRAHERYLDAGGLGILVGDGRLTHPAAEAIFEAYYDIAVTKIVHLSVDGQLVDHPAYNADRGPAPIIAARFHAQF